MVSVRPDFWSQATGLWAVQVGHKASVLGFSFIVGHRLGAEGVGVMASVLAMSWIGGTIAGMGLPDRAVFRGAAADVTEEHHRFHGFFLCSVALVHWVFWLGAGLLGGTTDPELVRFAQGLVVGAGAQCGSSVGLSWLRGANQVRPEITATVVSSVVLVAGALAGIPLGWTWSMGGLAMLLGALWGNRKDGIRPAMPALGDVPRVVREGVPYLLFGLGAWLIGNADILLARFAHPPDAVGSLQVGTMAVRGLGLVPWVAATLMLRALHKEWANGGRPRPLLWAVRASGVGVLVAALAWLCLPFLAQGHGISVASIEHPTWAAMLIAPVLYPVILLLPIAGQWNMGQTLRAIGMGLMTQIGVGFMAVGILDVASVTLVAGVGQLVTLLWLVNNLASTRGQRLEVDGGASLPSMGGAGDAGQVSPSVQVGSARSEE
jgi:hypothetical protein